MIKAPLEVLPGIPLDGGSPVFKEPWEAKAFAMTLALHERGLFTWPQWAAALSRQISLAQQAGDADLGDTYYEHWLAALESLLLAPQFPLNVEAPPSHPAGPTMFSPRSRLPGD